MLTPGLSTRVFSRSFTERNKRFRHRRRSSRSPKHGIWFLWEFVYHLTAIST